MDIPRLIQQQMEVQLGKQKVLILYGTQRTGKTTLIENIAAKYADQTMVRICKLPAFYKTGQK